jgi:hypothetical protein
MLELSGKLVREISARASCCASDFRFRPISDVCVSVRWDIRTVGPPSGADILPRSDIASPAVSERIKAHVRLGCCHRSNRYPHGCDGSTTVPAEPMGRLIEIVTSQVRGVGDSRHWEGGCERQEIRPVA